MPVINVIGASTSAARDYDDLFILVQLQPPRFEEVAALLLLSTQPRFEEVRLSVLLRTRDLRPPPLAPLAPLPAGDVVVAPPAAYLISHGGLDAAVESYSFGFTRGDDGTLRPTANLTVRGTYLSSAAFSIAVTATGIGGSFGQMYGPFMATSRVVEEKPSGTVTTLSSTDTSAADAEALTEMAPVTVEFLPWEAEKGHTSYEQAVAARAKAQLDRVKQVLLKSMPCALKTEALRDHRRVAVHDLIYWLLDKMPLPHVLGAPLPYPGAYFYAEPDTGIPFNGGALIGTSYQTYNKKPLDMLRDLLGRVGWQVVVRYGMVSVGPPPELSQGAAATAQSLEMPLELLSARKTEWVNADPQSAKMTAPRRYDLTGAQARKYLPPLPPESSNPEGNFETAQSAMLSGQSQGWRGPTGTIPDYITRWTKTKAGGVLVKDETKTDSWVPYTPDPSEDVALSEVSSDGSGQKKVREYWAEEANKRVVTYEYANPLYPMAETRQLAQVTTPVPLLRRSTVTETTLILSDWHAEGWLREKRTAVEKLDGWQKISHTDANSGATTTRVFPIHYYENEREEWTPLGAGAWQHVTTRTALHQQPVIVDGLVDRYQPVSKLEVVSETTTQGPPTVTGQGCASPDPGFAYEEALSMSVTSNGRADPVSIDVPWATVLDVRWATWTQANTNNRPCKRTTYTLNVPPRVEVGGVVKSFSGSGKAGSFSGEVVVEEVI